MDGECVQPLSLRTTEPLETTRSVGSLNEVISLPILCISSIRGNDCTINFMRLSRDQQDSNGGCLVGRDTI